MASWVQPPNTPKADFFPGPWSDEDALTDLSTQTFENTNPTALAVAVSFSTTTSVNSTLETSPDGSTWTYVAQGDAASSTHNFYAIVPPGYHWRFRTGTLSTSIFHRSMAL